ncbi:MAG: amidase [Dehalococcoidia bacterium]
MSTELHWLTLTELASRIRAREVSPVEASDALLARIDALEPSLGAFVTVTAEYARGRARQAESEIAAGNYLGPLHGVPIAVKDLCYTTWAPTSAGMAIHSQFMATENATVVDRLEAAGAVVLGKLKLTEGAYANHHPSVEPPKNPWNADRWTGVSSSGSGVATAAAMCFASLGSDTGGSIRFPSAMNGVVGIKPTWGRVSRHAVFALGLSLDHIGPMTRSVADAAAVLEVIAGRDPADPTSLPATVPAYTQACGRGVSGLRIGVDEAFNTASLDPEVVRLVASAGDVLRSLGAEIVPVHIPWEDSMAREWTRLCAAETALVHEDTFPSRKDEYGPMLASFIESGRNLSALELARSTEVRRRFNGDLAAVFADVELILCPSYGLATPPAEGLPQERDTTGRGMRFTAPFDFSGSPTISLPCGFTDDGMPASLQLVGRHLGEEAIIAAAAAYEAATGWRSRRPPLAP